MTDALTDRRSSPDEYPFVRPKVRVAPDNTVTAAPQHGAGSILSEAAGIVEGVRNQQHGDKERSFVAIANMWQAYLENRRIPPHSDGLGIRARDVATMMALMKMMRAEWGTPLRDHFVDMAGYSGIAGEIAIGGLRGGTPEG